MTAKRKAVSKKTRFEVFKRDSFTCQYCGAEAPKAVLHVDHILPVAEGGDNALTNLVTACSDCNLGKGARKLNDDTAITRQKQQLNELNVRREQLEMIEQWRSGLLDLTDREVEIAHQEWIDLTEFKLNDIGLSALRRRIKKYGLRDVLAGMTASCDRLLEVGDDCKTTHASVDQAWEKLDEAIHFTRLPDAEKRVRYINGIARNRMYISWENQDVLKDALRRYAAAGGCLDEAQERAKLLTKEDLWDWIDELHEACTDA